MAFLFEEADVISDFLLHHVRGRYRSGSTLIAAERTGRICLGSELDEHYCSLAIARWEAFTGKSATKDCSR